MKAMVAALARKNPGLNGFIAATLILSAITATAMAVVGDQIDVVVNRPQDGKYGNQNASGMLLTQNRTKNVTCSIEWQDGQIGQSGPSTQYWVTAKGSGIEFSVYVSNSLMEKLGATPEQRIPVDDENARAFFLEKCAGTITERLGHDQKQAFALIQKGLL